MKQASVISALLYCASTCLAHNSRAPSDLKWPIPLRSKLDIRYAYDGIDYNLMEPLMADGSDFPCKGYHNDRTKFTGAVLTSGARHNMTLSNTSPNHRGSCQISLSYDNGETFRVIKSVMGGCAVVNDIFFYVPEFAPEGTALFAWSWINRDRHPEFYMNCAQVEIVSPYTEPKAPPPASPFGKRGTLPGIGRRVKLPGVPRDDTDKPDSDPNREVVAEEAELDTKKHPTSMEHLPLMFVANLNSVSNCLTQEGQALVYPEPGPDVEYSDGLNKDSKPNEHMCDNVFAIDGEVTRPPTLEHGKIDNIAPLSEEEKAMIPAECDSGDILCNTLYTYSVCNAAGEGYVFAGQVDDGLNCVAGKLVNPNPLGKCDKMDALQCYAEDNRWKLCDMGVWVDMGPVGDTSICQDGKVAVR